MEDGSGSGVEIGPADLGVGGIAGGKRAPGMKFHGK